MTKRFCTSCQSDREQEGGVFRRGPRTNRWICQSCVEHKTESIYRNTSGKLSDTAHVLRQLYGRAR